MRRAPVKNAEEDCSVAEVYLMAGPNEVRLRAALDLLEQVLSEPFYDQLRTKEQLGYSVHASTRLTHGILGFAFVVVSGARCLLLRPLLSSSCSMQPVFSRCG